MNILRFKIAIIGLGYVGLPLAVSFAKKFRTVAFDVKKDRVCNLKNGKDLNGEVEEQALVSSKNLYFTDDQYDLADCNFFIVAVPTPVDENKSPDLNYLKTACATVAQFLKSGDFVVFESTVYPGLTNTLCKFELESLSGLKCENISTTGVEADTFHLGYSPERVNPGDPARKLSDIVKITSGVSKFSSSVIDQAYSAVIDAGTCKATSIEVAEAAKVVENVQRDLNIALMNELSQLFLKLGLSTREVLAVCSTKWNFLNFKPGLVGGHCIGVDPYYLTHRALAVGHNPDLILAGRKVNDAMPQHVVSRVLTLMLQKNIAVLEAKILIAGITFKENCADTRNSGVLHLVKSFSDLRCIVEVFDPVHLAESISCYGPASVVEYPSFKAYDAVVIAVPHDDFKKMGIGTFRNFGKPNHIIFDVEGAFEEDQTHGTL